MDINQIHINFADLMADYSLGKRIVKHYTKILIDIKIIDAYLSEHIHEPNDPKCQQLMMMGYWYYRIVIEYHLV